MHPHKASERPGPAARLIALPALRVAAGVSQAIDLVSFPVAYVGNVRNYQWPSPARRFAAYLGRAGLMTIPVILILNGAAGIDQPMFQDGRLNLEGPGGVAGGYISAGLMVLFHHFGEELTTCPDQNGEHASDIRPAGPVFTSQLTRRLTARADNIARACARAGRTVRHGPA